MNFSRASAMISGYESWPVLDASTSTFPPQQVVIERRNKCNVSMNADAESKFYFYGWPFVVPMSFVLIVAILVTVFGNILVILTIWRHRGMRTRTNLFLANLALADILVGLLDMPFSVATLIYGDWHFGKGVCQFNAFTNGLGLMTSTHTLMLISIHKYISITRPFAHMSTGVISMMIAAAWLWSTIYNLAPIYGWTKVAYKKGATQCGPIMPCTPLERSHSYCNTLINLVTPIVVMIFCNVRIFRAVGQHLTRMRQTSNMDFRNTILQQRRITVTLVIVIVCFFLCWTPYTVYSCMIALSKDHEWVPRILNPISYWCGYINSACNPIIYALRSPSFRQGYKEILFGHTSEVSTGSFYSGSMIKPSRHKSHPNRRHFKKQRNKASFKGYTNSYVGRTRPGKPPLLQREGSAPAMLMDITVKIPKPIYKSNGAQRQKKTQSSPNILCIYQRENNEESQSKKMLQIVDGTRKPWRSIEFPNDTNGRDSIHGSLEELNSLRKKRTNPDQNEESMVSQFNGHSNLEDIKPNEKFLHQEMPSVTITTMDESTDVEASEEGPDESLPKNSQSNMEALSLALGGSLEKLHRQITRKRAKRHHCDNSKETGGEPQDLMLLHPNNDDTQSTRSTKSIRTSLYSFFRRSTEILTGQTRSTDELQTPSNPKTNE